MPRTLTEAEIHKFRDELCGVATRLFAEKGFGGVTMRALAQQLGCSPMTPYRYFENKEEVFDAVRTQAFARLSERVAAAAEREPALPERIRALGWAYVRFALDEPDAYRIMFHLDQTSPGGIEQIPEHVELRRGWQILCDAMEEGVAAGLLAGQPVQLAHLAWVSLHGCVTLHLAGKLELGMTLHDLVDPLLDHFLRGTAVRPPVEGARS